MSRSHRPLCWLALLLFCAAPAVAAAAADAALLRRGNGPDVETLDPHKVRSVAAGNVVRDLYEGLLTEAADGRLVPGVAERWEIDDDGRRYRFWLRDNARWSNGEPLTAQDVVAGLRRSVDPATASPSAQLLTSIAGAAAIINGSAPPASLAVDARSDRELEIRLQQPTPYLLALLVNPAAFPVYRAASPRLRPRSPTVLINWRAGCCNRR